MSGVESSGSITSRRLFANARSRVSLWLMVRELKVGGQGLVLEEGCGPGICPSAGPTTDRRFSMIDIEQSPENEPQELRETTIVKCTY